MFEKKKRKETYKVSPLSVNLKKDSVDAAIFVKINSDGQSAQLLSLCWIRPPLHS